MTRRSRWPTSWSSWIAWESERSRPICTVILWCSPNGEHLDLDFDARFALEQGRLVDA